MGKVSDFIKKENEVFSLKPGHQRAFAEDLIKKHGMEGKVVWNDMWTYDEYGHEHPNPDHGFTKN